MNYGIIIITRDRLDMLEKVLPNWMEQDVPITLLTERSQINKTWDFLEDQGWDEDIMVAHHDRANLGVGYARASAVNLADHIGYGAFVLADDDTRPHSGDVRKILNFVGKKKGITCAGWMPNYGLWIEDGNTIGKEPDLVIPRGSAPDRIMAHNTELVLKAGNYNPKLNVYHDTSEINRRGIASGHLWYIHSGFHIQMVNKPKDPGGIAAFAGTKAQRDAGEQKCHEIVYKEWGERYISHPSKRYACRWLRMIEDHIGQKAVDAVRGATVYEETEVTTARRMFR